MKAIQEAATGPGNFELLLRVDMDVAAFSSNWAYCDRLSSYMARMVSHNRTDSLLYSNLLSSALNELLETAFRSHDGKGKLTCSVSRLADRDRIELNIPCSETGATFFHRAVSRISKPEAELGEDYRETLFADGPVDPAIGLLELAVDYDAELAVEQMDGNALRLIAELALEDAES